jgi:hypothetical protein
VSEPVDLAAFSPETLHRASVARVDIWSAIESSSQSTAPFVPKCLTLPMAIGGTKDAQFQWGTSRKDLLDETIWSRSTQLAVTWGI